MAAEILMLVVLMTVMSMLTIENEIILRLDSNLYNMCKQLAIHTRNDAVVNPIQSSKPSHQVLL